jgi:hypothetical protein
MIPETQHSRYSTENKEHKQDREKESKTKCLGESSGGGRGWSVCVRGRRREWCGRERYKASRAETPDACEERGCAKEPGENGE